MARMRGVVFTPFSDASELLSLRALLHSRESISKRRLGVDTVNAYKVRGHVLVEVESTALLVEARLSFESHAFTPLALRAILNSAFCRFVTRICDPLKSDGVRGISSRAAVIGLPRHLVDLRHQCTHHELPSSTVLIRAIDESLEWLWSYYWSRLDETSKTSQETNPVLTRPSDPSRTQAGEDVRDELQRNLKEYRAARVTEMKRANVNHQDLSATVNGSCVQCIRLCKGKEIKLRALVDILISGERLLIPKDLTLDTSMLGSQTLWNPLLRRLTTHQYRFLPLFIVQIADHLFRPTRLDVRFDPFRKALCSWIIHIFNSAEWNRARAQISTAIQQVRTEMDADLEERAKLGPDNDLRAMVMQLCMLNPGYWAFILGRQMCDTADTWFRHDWTGVYNSSLKCFESFEDILDSDNASEKIDGAEKKLLTMENHSDWCKVRLLEPPSQDELQEAGIHHPQHVKAYGQESNRNGQMSSAANTSGWKKSPVIWWTSPIGPAN